MRELLRKLALQKLAKRKLAQDDQNEPQELNEFIKGDTIRERKPVEPEDIQEKEPMQLAQAEPSQWQKLVQFLQPKQSPEPTPIDPNAPTVTDAIQGVLQRKQLDEQLKQQLGK